MSPLTSELLYVLMAVEAGTVAPIAWSPPASGADLWDCWGHSDVTFTLDNGWAVTLFFDGWEWGDLDYISHAVAPDGRKWEPEDTIWQTRADITDNRRPVSHPLLEGRALTETRWAP